MKQTNQIPGLYDPSFEHDNCGIGACVNIKGVKNHQTVDNALKIVETLEHRAGKDAAGETGDGVGIMLQISHKFFSKACKAANINIGKEREYGIGMFFFPNDELRLRQAKKMFEIIVEKEGMTFLGWREVPTTPTVLGKKALECMPKILQGFVAKPADVEKGLDFDRKLYIARKVFEQSNEESYVVSLSSRTIVYKGMFLVGQLRTFFNDLQDSDYESAIALVHSRFSTNTTPSWEKAHPYRFIVHNGEISSYDANRRFIEMFGYGFLAVLPKIIVSYVVGLGIEFVVAQWKKEEIQEGFLVSGMLIPMIVPVDCPLWMLAVATAFSVIFAKEVFGGTGMNIFNPALITRAFLFFAYPTKMSGDAVWVSGDSIFGLGKTVDGLTAATRWVLPRLLNVLNSLGIWLLV